MESQILSLFWTDDQAYTVTEYFRKIFGETGPLGGQYWYSYMKSQISGLFWTCNQV